MLLLESGEKMERTHQLRSYSLVCEQQSHFTMLYQQSAGDFRAHKACIMMIMGLFSEESSAVAC